jgi:hypothetical protein
MSLRVSRLAPLAALLLAGSFSFLLAQDTRTVTQPTFPTTCTTLAATQSITSAGEPTSETAFDTTRLQTALNGAAAACSGKTVELTTGGTNGVYNVFLIQPIFIPSGVTLVIDAGVTVFASRNPADYQVGTPSGTQDTCGTVGQIGNGCYQLITAGSSLSGGTSSGSAIMGYGIINGRGGDNLIVNGVTQTYSWWTLANNANTQGNGATQNNPILIYLSKASNFTMYKITLQNSPMFHVKYQTATGFTVWGVKIKTPYTSRNTDGIDPDDNVSNMTVQASYIADGDDNIAIGATAGNPVSNITVNGVYTYSGHGISIGSYTAGGVSNVLVENSNQSGNQNDTNAAGLKIKSAKDRGGLVNNVQYNGICIQNQRYPLQFNPNYNTNAGTSYPSYNNIGLHNISITALGVGSMEFDGSNAANPLNVTFDNLYAGSAAVTPATAYANITIGPGPVRPVALQTMTGTGVTYSGATTKPNEAQWACSATNYPFLQGELFLSTTGTSAATNQQSLSLSNPASFTLNAVLQTTDASTPTPTAGINFYTGTTLVGSGTIGALGSGNGTVATLSLTGVTSGVHTYTAQYPGDANYSAITFGSVTVNVGVIGTTTTMTATPTTASYGQSVVLSATVTPTTGTVVPTGTVTFYSNGVSIGTGAVNTTTGIASLTTSTLAVGTDSLYASYGGSTQNGSSSSSANPTSVTIAFASTTTTLAATPTSAIYGSTVTLTATVRSSTTGTPTDTVSFYDGTTLLGTQTLTAGTAVFTTTALTAGTHSALTAVYGGDVNFNGSTSAAANNVTIFASTTTTQLGLSGTSAPYGTSISMLALIINNNGGASATTATGTVSYADSGTAIGSGTVASGSATYATTTLAVGAHNIVATYSGDSDFAGSSSANAPLTITQAGTSSTLSATSNNIVYGTSDTITVTVSPSTSGTPTGTVLLKDGGVAISTLTLSGGTASYTAAALTGGTHSITCTYSGDTNFTASTCAALVITVSTASSSTGLAAPASITYGTSAALSATVTSTATGTPTGTITFKDGATVLNVAAMSGGTAAYSAPGLTGGSHSITAVYSGDTNFATSTSAVSTLVVNKAATTSAVSANPATITFGTSTTLTATVSPSTATGTFTFYNGSVSIGTGTISGGVATLAISTLPVGTDTVAATYSGDTNYNTSTSTAASVIVNKATSTTVVSANPTTITYGGSTTLSATVTPTAASGTVTFYDGTTSLGPGTLASGVATFNATTLGGGTHSITAVYAGDSNDTTSTSAAITVTVTKASTMSAVTANPNPITYGAATTLTATVNSSAATGTFTFYDGTTSLGSGTIAGGVATFSATALAGGPHTITAVYSGDSNFTTSTSAVLTVTVNKAATTSLVTANPSTITYGASTTLTATVTSSAATGTFTFFDGATNLGSGTIFTGSASITAASLAGGSHSITAVYSGDSNYATSTSTATTLTVNKAATTATVAADPTTLTYGATTNLTATVSPATATGTFVFYDGTTSLGIGAIASGVATLNNVALGGGMHSITAVYSSDTNYAASTTTAVTVTVNQAPATASLTANPNPVTYGNSVQLTATLSPTTATGTITFKDGATTLGTTTAANGVATYTATGLTGGSHSLTCSYSGSANYTTATCSTVTLVVNTAATTTTVAANPTTLTYGSSTVLTATVSSTTATGSVTFKDGATTLGTATVSNGVATYTAAGLPGGSHSITAVYSGDTNYAASTSTAVTVTVNTAATTTTVAANPNPLTYGSATTLTATVSGTTATGTVTFKDGATTLGSGTVANGVTTFNGTLLAGGTHSITAVYSGDNNYTGSTSAAITVTVNTATLTPAIAANPTSGAFGTNIVLTVTLGNTAATGTVTFKDGTTTLGTGTVAGGVATFSTSGLAVGSHSIGCAYAGDTNFSAATCATPVAVSIALAATTSSVNANPTTLTYGSATLLTATVSPSAATGTFTFKDGTTTVSSGNISNGVATFNATALTAGSHSITVVYSGDANYSTSTSAITTVTVNQLATTTNVAANPTTLVYGSSTVLTATISNTNATGSVTFKDGSTTLGTGTVASGIATYTAAGLTVGTHSITAVYSGDTNYAMSTSAATTVTVTLATTATTIGATPLTSAFGTPTTITVTVVPGTATGSVTIKDGATILGTATLASGVATYIANFTAGTHTLSATYGGDSNFSGSSTTASVSVTITVASSTTTASSSPSSVPFGLATTLSATISPTTGTGTITFRDTGSGLALGTATLSNGTASIAGVLLSPAGAHSIMATYSGDANVGGSTSAVTIVTVTSGATAVTLANSPASPVMYGTNLTLSTTQTVLLGVAPTGTITYYDATTKLGSAPITLNSSNAPVTTFSISTLMPGAHSLTAVYSGDGNYASSTSTVDSVTVTQGNSTTTLVATPSQVVPNQNFILTATAAGTSGTPTGSVTFFDQNNANLGTVALVSGSASITLFKTALGTYTYTATYSGDTDFNSSSTAAPTSVVVKQLSSSTAIVATPTSGTFGTGAYSLTATVAPASAGPATGSVVFKDGATILGTITLGSSDIAILSGLSLAGGAHTINAFYSGDPTFTSSDSTAAPATVTVNVAPSTTGLSVTPGTSNFGTSITFSATVSNSTSTTATGTMTFKNGATVLGTGTLANGAASFTTTTLAIGTYTVTAVYSGDTNFAASTSTATTVTVNQDPQSITESTLPTTLTYGAAPFIVTASASSGLAVSLSVTGPATLNGSTVTITGAGTVTISAAQPGNTQYAAATSIVSTIIVAKAPLSVTTNNQSMLAGATIPTLTGTITGIVNGDNITATYSTTATPSSPAGTYPITATLVDPNSRLANYTVTNAGGTLTVTANSQTITFPSIPTSAVYGVAPITLTATASSKLTVAYTVTGPAMLNGSVLTILGIGTVTVTANQAGNNIYSAATPVTQTMSVSAEPLTVATNNMNIQAGAAIPTLTGTITGIVNGDNITATYSTTATSASPAGTYPISATLVDPNNRLPNYAVTNPGGTLTITINSQTITFPAVPTSVTYGVAPITLSATASSGLAVTYSVSGPATLTGSTLTITGAGTVVVTAAQAGNIDYSAATSVSQTVTVSKASLSLTAANASRVYGAANPSLTGTLTGVVNSDNITATYATTATTTSAVGTYPITPTLVDPANRLVNYNVTNTAGTLTVTAASTTTLLTLSAVQILANTAVTLTATVSPSAATGTVTFYSGTNSIGAGTITAGIATLTVSNLAVGSYSLTASFPTGGNYTGSTSSAAALSVVAPVTLGLSPTSLSLAAAASGTSTLMVTPALGYTGAVTLACMSPVTYVTCTVTTPVTITGTTPATATVSINVAATASLHYPQIGPRSNHDETVFARFLPLAALLLLPLLRRRKLLGRRALSLFALLLVALTTTFATTGCGSSSPSAQALPPAGPQTITITATASGTPVTTTLTVNITN